MSLVEASKNLLEACYQADALGDLPSQITGELMEAVRDALIAEPMKGITLTATCPTNCPHYADGKHRWTETVTLENGASMACKCGISAIDYDAMMLD